MLVYTMRDTYGRLIEMIYEWLNHDYTVLGVYSFSLWDVILFTIISGVIAYVFWEFMRG